MVYTARKQYQKNEKFHQAAIATESIITTPLIIDADQLSSLFCCRAVLKLTTYKEVAATIIKIVSKKVGMVVQKINM